MFSDIFHDIAVFIYTYYWLIATIVIALFILNFVRTRMVAARRRRVQREAAARRTKKSSNKFDPFA